MHVPASPADSISDVIAKTGRGDTDYAMSPISIAAPQVKDGCLVALGVTSTRRSPLLPEVPTIAEAGISGYDFPIWYGLWAPAGTPRRTVDKLANDISAALAAGDPHYWFAKHGADPISMTQAEFAQFVLNESQRATQIIKDAGIELQ